MASHPVKFSEGLVTSRPREDLAAGELQRATGIWYKPGDTSRAHKIRGRSEFGDTGSGVKVKGVALCKFDADDLDRVFAYSGNTLYRALAGETGTFSAFQTGLNPLGENLTAVHYDDVWFLGNGYDRQFAIASDGSTIRMGMTPPSTGPVAVATAVAQTANSRPATATTSSWTSAALAYDPAPGGYDTYAYIYMTSLGTSYQCTWSGWGSSTDANRVLRVVYQMDWNTENSSHWTYSQKRANITISYSLTGAAGPFITLVQYPDNSGPIGKSTAQVPIPIGTNSNTVFVKVTTSIDRADFFANFKVYDISIGAGSETGNFDMEFGGVYYAITEVDTTRSVGGAPLESDPATMDDPLDFTAKNYVTLTLPTTPTNANTTSLNIYRTVDGGSNPRDFRLIAPGVPIGTATFVDDFVQYGKDTPGGATLGLIKVQPDPDVEADYFFARTLPEAFSHMNAHGPFLVGLSPAFPRALFWSLPDAPHYWPALYVNTKWPLPERDELVCTATVGDSLVVGAREAMLIMDGMSEVVAGEVQSANVRPMRGQPGVVSVKAMVSFSISGEPRAAWVSQFGVHITNAQTAARISDDLDWENTVSVEKLESAVLHWDRERALLIFAYDSDGDSVNDALLYFHMDPRHGKENGNPKITGPHYGKISCMTAGIVGNTYRTYSGHFTDGSVYVENNGTTDASQSYNGGSSVPLLLTTGRTYGPDSRDIEVTRGHLRHTDAGSGETATLTSTAYRDADSTSSTVEKSVSVAGQGGDAFWIAQSGESHEFTVEHEGAAEFALLDMRLEVRTTGKAGTVRIA